MLYQREKEKWYERFWDYNLRLPDRFGYDDVNAIVGDAVKRDDILVEIETDKVVLKYRQLLMVYWRALLVGRRDSGE